MPVRSWPIIWLLAAATTLGLAACGSGATPSPPRARATLGPDRLRYDLDLVHGDHTLTGEERIRFRNPAAKALDHVWIRAWDNAFGTCGRKNVSVEALAGGRITKRRLRCTALRLDLDAPLEPGAQADVRLKIAIRTPRGFDRFGRLGDVDVLGNAIPVLAVSHDGREPELPRYSFTGESFYSLVADWTARIRLRPGESVAATGTQTAAEDDTVTLRADGERDFTLVIGPMQQEDRTVDGITVRWWTPEGTSRGRAAAGLRIATRGLAALQGDLGSYGARELDILDAPPNIADGAGVAMEYPQLILSPPYAPALVHELAHQWFYRVVGNDEWSDPWVDETLTSFAAMRTGRRVHGPNRLRGCAEHDRPARPPAPVDSDMGTLERLNRRREKASRDTLYIEGPCALFNLQRRIGEGRMTAFLRKLVQEHRGGVLTSAQLRDAIARLPTGDEAVDELRLGG